MELSRLSAEDVEEARQSPPKMTSGEPKQESGERLSFGVPPARCDNTFMSFDLKRAPKMEAANDRCFDVARGAEWCAFLWGRVPGNGKTHLAIAALNRHAARRSESPPGGVFWKVPDFLAFLRELLATDIREGWGPKVEKVITGYQSANFLLVLDDLGVENQTDWANEQLYRVLDGRYENRAPTIITSNAPLDSLDPRIRSRFREGWVVCEGKDLR